MALCATLTVTANIPTLDCTSTHYCDANCPGALTSECQSPNPCVANHCATGCPDAMTCGLCGIVDSGDRDTSPTASRMNPLSPCYALPVYASGTTIVVNKVCTMSHCTPGCVDASTCGECNKPACATPPSTTECDSNPCMVGCPYVCGCTASDPCPVNCTTTPCALTCPNATNCTICPSYTGCQYTYTCDSANCASPSICVNGVCTPQTVVCDDTSCPSPNTCVGGVCTPPAYQCSDTNCPSPNSCIGGVCLYVANQCSDTNCPTPKSCVAGVCTSPVTNPVDTTSGTAGILSILSNPPILALLGVGLIGIVMVNGNGKS
jgi:hypothetical protein